ncbi:hypothetical protein ACRAWF_40900 [Streptomyces sp. L7]
MRSAHASWFPRELERYAEGAGFEVLDMLYGTAGVGLTGPTAYTVPRYTGAGDR